MARIKKTKVGKFTRLTTDITPLSKGEIRTAIKRELEQKRKARKKRGTTLKKEVRRRMRRDGL